MCEHCSLPYNRFLIRDRRTGAVFCEECGCVQGSASSGSGGSLQYIWELNTQWPSFDSFQDLVRQLTAHGQIDVPPCRLVREIPSLLLTYALEKLGNPKRSVH
jgi:hypothetical protein